LVLLLGPIARWATPEAIDLKGKERADAITATRQILLAATGGTAVLTGLGFTARTFYLSKRGQFTDRYTQAITQLASDKLTERLGGIYALEHLMRESYADHPTVIDVLATFIRENAPISPDNAHPPDQPSQPPKPRADIQAALTVLGRRPKRPELPWHLDLSGADLRGASLPWARLQHAKLERTLLQHANLAHAYLDDAYLRNAQLQHASLVQTHMERADLIDAQLDHAWLQGAHLGRADLRRAQLQHTRLQRAQLQHALLTGARLDGASLRDAQLQNAHLAGGPTRDYGPINDEDADGAQLQDANLTGAQLHGANLAVNRVGHAAPVRGLTAEQLTNADFDETTKLPHDIRQALRDHAQRQADSGPLSPP
jgi:uncharacterized protein YjbI with pentapeptide repeats